MPSILRYSYKIADFLAQPHPENPPDDPQSRPVFIGLAGIAILFLTTIIFLYFYQGKLFQGGILLVLLGVVLGSTLSLRYFRDIKPVFRVNAGLGIGTFAVLSTLSPYFEFSSLYLFLFPVYALLALGSREGLFWCVGSFLLLGGSLFLFDPLEGNDSLLIGLKFHLLMIYGFITGLIFFLDLMRKQEIDNVLTENYYLKKRIRELNEIVSVERSSKQKIEDELFEVGQAVTVAKQTKNKFLSNMNYELRSPLHSILGITDLLKKKIRVLNKDLIEIYLDKVSDQGKELFTLISELTTLSTLESGAASFVFQRAEMGSLVNEVVSQFSSEIEEKRMTVSVETAHHSYYVAIDISKIRSVLETLISNAIRFSTPNSQLHLSLFIDDSYLNCSIESEALKALPENLFIGSERGRLGEDLQGDKEELKLAICYQIIKAHRGYIWGERDTKKGGRITFKFPYILK